jgi:hypothetical protein
MAEGIMSLPDSPEMMGEFDATASPETGPEVSPEDRKKFEDAVREYANADPVRFGNDLMGAVEEADPETVREFRDVLSSVDMPDELVDAMGQMVDALMSEPENYEENRQEFIAEGVPEELLPVTFDAAYFTALNIALDQISEQKNSRPEMPDNMEFAEGGLATLAGMGRGPDTMLAHITPSEARLLRRRGGSGTINPDTGLPEFFFKKLFKAVGKVFKGAVNVVKAIVKPIVNVVKKVAENPIGRVLLTVGATMLLGPGSALFGGAGLAGSLGMAAMPNLALAFNTAAASTLVNWAGGQKFGDALKNGMIAGATAGIGAKVLNLTPEAYTKAAEQAAGAKASGLGESYAGDIPVGKELSAPAPIEDRSVAVTSAKDVSANVGSPASASELSAAAGSPTTATKVAEQSWLGKTFGKPGEWVNDNILPGGIKQKGEVAANEAFNSAYKDAIAKGVSDKAATTLAQNAYDAAVPGLLRTYGPLAAVGIGGAYLAGAFDPATGEEAAPPPGYEGMIDERYAGKTGYQLIEEDPEKWAFKRGDYSTGYHGFDPYSSNYLSGSAPQYAAKGGEMTLDDFPRKTGKIDGPGTGTSDSIPAMLSDGEFVFTAKAVRGAGNGSRRAGAARMYALMKSLEKSNA